MAEELVKAQKSLREMDYDSMSEEEEEVGEEDEKKQSSLVSFPTPKHVIDANNNNTNTSSNNSSRINNYESTTSLERFFSSTDDDDDFQKNNNSNNILIDFDDVIKPSSNNTNIIITTADENAKLLYTKKTPAPNSLFDDDDSTAAFTVELQTFNSNSNNNNNNNNNDDITKFTTTNGGTVHTTTYPGTAGYLEMEEEPSREVYKERNIDNNNSSININNNINNSTKIIGDSIRTDSGLVLTHRKIPAVSTTHRNHQQQQQQQQQRQQNPAHRNHLQHHNTQHHDGSSGNNSSGFRDAQQDYFEVENGVFRGWNKDNPNFQKQQQREGYFGSSSGGIGGRQGNYTGGGGMHSMTMVRAKRLMSFVRIWVVLFSLILLAMTGVFLHSLGHHEDPATTTSKRTTTQTNNDASNNNDGRSSSSSRDVLLSVVAPEEILLLPMEDVSQLSSSSAQQKAYRARVIQQQQQQQQQPLRLQPPQLGQQHRNLLVNSVSSGNSNGNDNSGSSHRFLLGLRQEFEDWMMHHNKAYHSEEEKQHRFSIWSQNHERTAEKNRRHGPCTLTKQHVFGSNHFKDLAPEEFQAKFLTGYKGAFTDVLEDKRQEQPPDIRRLRKDSGIVLNPKIHKLNIHESVVQKQRHLNNSYKPQVMGSSSMYCKWYDLSCVLRYIWQSTGIQFGSLIGTMEPKYDADAFPNSVDWRDSGAISDIRTQGECGACWAVTAVEEVESAVFLSTGTLYALSESEIIVCDDSCEMCSGGWPQNAFEWVMDHGGLPLQSSFPYDEYTLIALTAGLEGESDYYNEDSVESYRSETCPADGDNSGSGSNSNDGNSYWEDGMENENYADYSNQGRYGNIRGYGYATDRCLCYSDGSGCDCEDQDEDTAINNIATYGPSVVCLEASTWQDYGGGIITSDSGCAQTFLDMNHCVQVVGYDFTTGSSDCNDSNDEGCDSNDENSGSDSGSNSGSGDSNGREGYWIVRNQWGANWGMNGYAYVSMGTNTCGILNDMTIAYA